jgi:CRISPR/Cas system-associated endoribonuclease Cas2
LEAVVNAIYSVFEGSINKWAERILALVDQQTKYLQEELDAQIQGI